MRDRFRDCTGKACEFADAYVIAHDVGHHVQNLLGILSQAQSAQKGASGKVPVNRAQVRVELQADCLAGIWSNHSNQRWKSIEPVDVEAARQNAAAVGDDRLQKRARGYVVPDNFTHGSAAQRRRWFTSGLKEGKISACNTFAAESLLSVRRMLPSAVQQAGVARREVDRQANDSNGPRISTLGSRVSVWVIPTDEELMIAQHTLALISPR